MGGWEEGERENVACRKRHGGRAVMGERVRVRRPPGKRPDLT